MSAVYPEVLFDYTAMQEVSNDQMNKVILYLYILTMYLEATCMWSSAFCKKSKAGVQFILNHLEPGL